MSPVLGSIFSWIVGLTIIGYLLVWTAGFLWGGGAAVHGPRLPSSALDAHRHLLQVQASLRGENRGRSKMRQAEAKTRRVGRPT
jgi:hypothetical protein